MKFFVLVKVIKSLIFFMFLETGFAIKYFYILYVRKFVSNTKEEKINF